MCPSVLESAGVYVSLPSLIPSYGVPLMMHGAAGLKQSWIISRHCIRVLKAVESLLQLNSSVATVRVERRKT